MSTVQELQQHIHNLDGKVKLGEALKRLTQNADFRLVFLETLSVLKVSELTQELSKHSATTEEYARLVRELDFISHLHKYLLTVADDAASAVADIHEAKAAFHKDEEDE